MKQRLVPASELETITNDMVDQYFQFLRKHICGFEMCISNHFAEKNSKLFQRRNKKEDLLKVQRGDWVEKPDGSKFPKKPVAHLKKKVVKAFLNGRNDLFGTAPGKWNRYYKVENKNSVKPDPLFYNADKAHWMIMIDIDNHGTEIGEAGLEKLLNYLKFFGFDFYIEPSTTGSGWHAYVIFERLINDDYKVDHEEAKNILLELNYHLNQIGHKIGFSAVEIKMRPAYYDGKEMKSGVFGKLPRLNGGKPSECLKKLINLKPFPLNQVRRRIAQLAPIPQPKTDVIATIKPAAVHPDIIKPKSKDEIQNHVLHLVHVSEVKLKQLKKFCDSEPCAFQRDHKIVQFMLNGRKNVPELDEVLAFKKKHGLYSGDWEDWKNRRERISDILSFYEKSHQGYENKTGFVSVIKKWIELNYNNQRLDDLAAEFFKDYEGDEFNKDHLRCFITLIWAMTENPMPDGSMPRDLCIGIWSSLNIEGVFDVGIRNERWTALRKFAWSIGMCDVKDTNYWHYKGNSRAMIWGLCPELCDVLNEEGEEESQEEVITNNNQYNLHSIRSIINHRITHAVPEDITDQMIRQEDRLRIENHQQELKEYAEMEKELIKLYAQAA